MIGWSSWYLLYIVPILSGTFAALCVIQAGKSGPCSPPQSCEPHHTKKPRAVVRQLRRQRHAPGQSTRISFKVFEPIPIPRVSPPACTTTTNGANCATQARTESCFLCSLHGQVSKQQASPGGQAISGRCDGYHTRGRGPSISMMLAWSGRAYWK